MGFSVLVLALVLPADAGYGVSSFKKETKRGANFWNVTSAIDGNLETCWMVDPQADNTGQWIEVDTPVGHVDKLGVVIGWDKDEESFADYHRVKKAKIQVINLQEGEGAVVYEGELAFEDKRGWQELDLPDVKVGGEYMGGRVRMMVTETYEGKDYPTLAMSEFLVHMKEFDAEGASIAEPPASSEDGKDAALMFDGSTRSFWASADNGVGQSFSIDPGSYGVSSLGIQSGPTSHARPKSIEVEVDGSTRKVTLENKSGLQWVRLPSLIGYTGSAWGDVKVTVLETYPGSTEGKGVAISELKLRATNVEDF